MSAGILVDVNKGIVSPVFAGREAELAVMAGAFEAAAAGTPGTVLLGAEAGGGKSRLAGEFAARVADRAVVLAGGCVQLSGAGLPYAPFAAALRELVRERGAAEVAALLPGQGAGELAWLLPEFGPPAAGRRPGNGPRPAVRAAARAARGTCRAAAGGPDRGGRALGRPADV